MLENSLSSLPECAEFHASILTLVPVLLGAPDRVREYRTMDGLRLILWSDGSLADQTGDDVCAKVVDVRALEELKHYTSDEVGVFLRVAQEVCANPGWEMSYLRLQVARALDPDEE